MINKIKEKYNTLKSNTKRYVKTAKDVAYMAKETIDTAKVGYKVVKEFNNLNNQYAKANSNNFNTGYHKTNNSKSNSYKKSNIDVDNKDAIDVEFEEL